MSRGAAQQQRSEEAPPTRASHGPGPRLRDGRVARSMTLEEAAELLKLDPSILAALERDDFTALPESLYVRGYLTSYARLLGIPEAEVVREHRAFSGEASAPSLSTRRPIQEHSALSDVGIRWFSYALMIGIVGLVGLWGYQRLPLESTTDTAPSAFVEEPSPPSTVAVVEPTESQPIPPPAAMEPTQESVTEPLPPPEVELQQPPEVVEPESDLAEVAAYTAVPESAEPVAPTAPIAEQAEVDEPSADEIVAVEEGQLEQEEAAVGLEVADPDPAELMAAAAPEAGTGVAPEELAEAPETSGDTGAENAGSRPVDRLELSFSRDCWVEIRDSEEQRLVYGLAKAGTRRQVEGRAPFRILVGDSGAVEIRLNGEITARSLYDAGDGRPARFTLGDEELQAAASP